jgi:hypothetical protein
MARSVIFAIVWSVIMYFGACMLVGAGAGCIATARMGPGENPATVGAEAGANAVQASRLFLGLAAISTAFAGSYFHVLPGTRKQRPPQPNENDQEDGRIS